MNEQQITSIDIGNTIISISFFILLIAIALIGLWYVWKFYLQKKLNSKKQKSSENNEQVVIEDKTADSMNRLITLLSTIEPNVERAESCLLDAQVQTEILVNQILRVVQKVEELELRVICIENIISALQSDDRQGVVFNVAKLDDLILQKFLMSPFILRQDLKIEALSLLSYERGTVIKFGESYSRLVTSLVNQLSLARGKINGLQQQIQMLEATHPLLVIESSLKKSVDVLNLRAQPALRWTAKKEIPAQIQGYLN